MAKKAFNLGDYLQGGEMSKSDIDEQIRYLPLDRIVPDPANFYSLDGIEELAGNIELIGLQQPLRVRPDGADFMIVSGHRRRAACLLIRDGGSDMFERGVPCIVEYGEATPAMRELRMIYANSATRVMSSADLSRQAERVEALLYELKEQGVEFPGRMRDHVAEACKVSKTKIARLHAIRANIDRPLLEMFDAGKLSETVAYALAQTPVEQQRVICDAWLAHHATLEGIPEHFVREYAEHQAKLDKRICERPCNKGGVCINKDQILARLFDGKYDYKPCRYGTCCDECSSYLSCKQRCPFTEEKAKRERERQREANRNAAAAKKSEDEHKVFLIEHLWATFGAAIAAAGMTDKELRASLKEKEGFYNPFELYMPDEKRKALLDFTCTDVKPGDRLPYFVGFGVDDYVNLCKVADALNVSIDYLFMRDDVPNRKKAPQEAQAELVSSPDTADPAAPVWECGAPPEKGWYLCWSQWCGSQIPYDPEYETLYWGGCGWDAYENDEGDPDYRVMAWSRIPPPLGRIFPAEAGEEEGEAQHGEDRV